MSEVSDKETERPEHETSPPTVYAFCNGRWGGEDQIWIAMCECGEVLGQHISSGRHFGISDVQPPFKRQAYREHLGGIEAGTDYQLVVLDAGQVPPDEVVARNQALGEREEASA